MAQHRAASRAVGEAFRPDVQGLRALAVTLVVVYHLYPGRLHGGYIGVDVFFVISGYLITGMLARASSTGRLSLTGFYARRARRLLPAAVLVLTVTWLLSRVVLPVTQLSDTATQIRASALYVQNWVLAHNSVDYLKAASAPTPVEHYWSLSVEEQFYLIWPLIFVFALVARRGRRAVTMLAATVIIGLSLAYSVQETGVNPAAAYFQTTTRIWELGIGGVLALLPEVLTRRVSRWGVLSWAGLAMILVAAWRDTASTPFPGTAALLPVLGAGLMLVCGSAAGHHGTAPVASLRPFVFVGDLSYSIYLWHWPMIVLWKAYAGPSLPRLDGLGIGAASVQLAWLTTKLIENPIRLGKVFTRSNLRGLAVATLAVIPVVLATSFLNAQPHARPLALNADHAGAGIVSKLPAPAPPNDAHRVDVDQTPRPLVVHWLPASAAHTSVSPLSSKIIPPVTQALHDQAIGMSPRCKANDWATRPLVCTFGDTVNPRLTVALVGDSHAAQWSTALDMIAKQQGWKLLSITHDSCTFGSATLQLSNQSTPFTDCHKWDEAVLSDLLTTIKPDVVIVTARVSAGVADHPHPDATSFAEIGRGEVDYWRQLLAHHIAVVAIHETPEPKIDIPDCLGSHGATVDGCAVPADVALVKHTPIDAASKIIGSAVPVINMNPYLCTVSVCPAVVGNVIVYEDRHHLTATYTRSVEPFLQAELVRIPALAP